MTSPIGYGKPPVHSRFRKGQSGNPSGRPKRPRKVGEDVLAELAELIAITEGGRPKRISKQRALVKALVSGALKGNTRAADLLVRWSATPDDAGSSASPPALTQAERKILENYLDRQVQRRIAKSQGDAS